MCEPKLIFKKQTFYLLHSKIEFKTLKLINRLFLSICMVKIKGYEFKQITVRDSYNRRAVHYKNKIIGNLKVFGITEDDIHIPLESMAMRKAQAFVSWYLWNEHLFMSYNGSSKFVENLAMVSQVIEYSILILDENKITKENFIKMFAEDKDIIEQRKNARTILGVKEDSLDFEEIHNNFKRLSKEYHPDMPNGNTEIFQEINNAHKLLKNELC